MNYLKKLAVTFLLLSMVGVGYSQIVNLGAHGGFNYPNLRINNAAVTQYKAHGGALVGAWARIGGFVYVQPEVNYVWTKSALTEIGGPSSGNINMHSIQLVASPGIRPVRKKMFNLRLGGTASYSFLLAVNSNSVGINRNDFRSGAIHVGPYIGFDVWRIAIDARYIWSLRNQASNSAEKWRNDMLQVTLGFRLFGER